MSSSQSADAAQQTTDKAAKRKKQAVVVIHGMGEQRPMDTLRAFVEAVWCRNPLVKAAPANGRNRIWIVPDTALDSYEQRRITTARDPNGVRTDFYEIYWADLMEGNTLQHLWAWLRGLLFRWPKDVPSHVFSAWLLLWFLAIVAAILFTWSISGEWRSLSPGEANPVALAALSAVALLAALVLLWRAVKKEAGPSGYAVAVLGPILFGGALYVFGPTEWLASGKALAFVGSLAIGVVLHNAVVPTFGDVARYVRAAPDTVEKRQAIRERALHLLNSLHDRQEYRRIVLVAHSLGSIIAYDVLMLLWAQRGPTRSNPPGAESVKALQRVDAFLGDRFEAAGGIDGFRKAQRQVFDALRREANPWLISDFITLGSPLTHAEFLLEPDAEEVRQAVADRLLATCPPVPDDSRRTAKVPSILYRAGGRGSGALAHHAAVFACVRWTNVYDPAKAIFFGDIISGRMKHFGEGIEEREVEIRYPLLFWKNARFFTHTRYWDWESKAGPSGTAHLECLWSALEVG